MDSIELRSEKVRNIIGKMPPFLIRSGISIIIFVFIGIIGGSYFFKYPVSISSKASLNPKTKTATLHILEKEIENDGAYKKVQASYTIDSKLSIQANAQAMVKIKIGEKRAIEKIVSFVTRE